MKVKTTRFGELKVEKNDILYFSEGLFGFEHLKKFFVYDPGDNTYILWLQSTEDVSIAFPIIEPRIFMIDYPKYFNNEDLTALHGSIHQLLTFSILTIPEEVSQISANLKAPILINNDKKIGKQIILQDGQLQIKQNIYKELKKAFLNIPNATDSNMIESSINGDKSSDLVNSKQDTGNLYGVSNSNKEINRL